MNGADGVNRTHAINRTHGVRNRFEGIGARLTLPYGRGSACGVACLYAVTEPGPEGTPLGSVRGLNPQESPRRLSTRAHGINRAHGMNRAIVPKIEPYPRVRVFDAGGVS